MAKEIERKFLVTSDDWRLEVYQSTVIAQGYILATEDRAVRVRRTGDNAFLTIKVSKSALERLEYEYPIPVGDAEELLEVACSGGTVAKTRHLVRGSSNLVWEIDEFSGKNAPLIVAELETPEVSTAFERPAWLGDEVTHDSRFLNTNLATRPWGTWS